MNAWDWKQQGKLVHASTFDPTLYFSHEMTFRLLLEEKESRFKAEHLLQAVESGCR